MAPRWCCIGSTSPRPRNTRAISPRKHKYVFVHPFDDPYIIAGRGTLALECWRPHRTLTHWSFPIGGGGPVAGCAVAARGVRPDIEIIGVESTTFPAMAQRLRDEPVRVGTETIAEGLAVRDIGEIPLTIARALVKDVLLVDEANHEEAIALLIEIEKTVTEGAGATGVAALLQHGHRFTGRKVGIVPAAVISIRAYWPAS